LAYTLPYHFFAIFSKNGNIMSSHKVLYRLALRSFIYPSKL